MGGDTASFGRATFKEGANFGLATFNGCAYFNDATFNGCAYFDATAFNPGVEFDGATFEGRAHFAANIGGYARFVEATFNGDEDSLTFAGSRVMSPDAKHVWPMGWCLGPDGKGGYTVVRANGAASQPIPGDGSDGASRSSEGR